MLRLGFGLIALLFLVLVIAALVLLSRANQDYGQLTIDRQAAQAAAAIEPWLVAPPPPDPAPPAQHPRREGGAIQPESRLPFRALSPEELTTGLPEVMENVLGLGVFTGRDGYVFAWGEKLPDPTELLGSKEGQSIQAFGDLVVRRSGGIVYYLKMGPGMLRARQGMQGGGSRAGMGMGRMLNQVPGREIIVLKYDGSKLLSGMYLRQTLIFGLGGAALLLFGGLAWLFLRIQRLQSEIDSQRALARLGTAARTLAHEIRNPLSIIVMQKSLLERQLGEEHFPALVSIGEEAKRIEFQIREVRRVLGQEGPSASATPIAGSGGTGTHTADFEPAFRGNPAPWLLELVDSMPAWKNRVIPIQAAPASGSGETASPALSGESLRSILVNLVDNALDAYTLRGAIDGTVEMRWSMPRGYLQIEVRDQAGGIARELRRRIFDPFFTTKKHGSGVGLSLARELAEAAGGRIAYRFRKPAGSSFVVTLPLSRSREGKTRP